LEKVQGQGYVGCRDIGSPGLKFNLGSALIHRGQEIASSLPSFVGRFHGVYRLVGRP
jgi:hypothetical protein